MSRIALPRALARLGRLSAKVGRHLRLLRDDPEMFGRNLLQVTDPARFEAGLIDIMDQPTLHVQVAPGLPAALNVLQPILSPNSMTGGPNTIVLLAALVAEAGVPVRIVTSRTGHRTEPAWFAGHVASLLGRAAPPSLSVVSGSEPGNPAVVGQDDLWLATHWTTAQAVRPVLERMRRPWFLYLVQDFEPGFYAWSSNYALALETYGLPHRAAINEAFLADHLRTQGPGLYADPAFLDQRCVVFEPAVDRRVFHPPGPPQPGAVPARPRRLLFYARPTNARNMLGLGLQALRAAIAAGAFPGAWEFVSIGGRGSVPVFDLGGGHALRPAPWASYGGYGDALRGADILLCPMLSPHTSYPVLEMAACGGTVVTNIYGPKTAAALAALSPDIIGVAPTLSGFVEGLQRAAEFCGGPRHDRLTLAANWDAVLYPVARWAAAAVRGPDGGDIRGMTVQHELRPDFERIRRLRNEARPSARLAHHFAVERRLARQLARSTKADRGMLYSAVYRELFSVVDDHPQHRGGSDVRQARIRMQVASLRTSLGPGATFVEIGCGDAALTKALAPYVAEAIGVDVTPELIDTADAPASFRFLETDGTTLALPDGSGRPRLFEPADGTPASRRCDRAARRDFFRVLKSGGRYICSTPNRLTGPHDISCYFGYTPEGFHLREYDHRSLGRLFRAVGFGTVSGRIMVKGRSADLPLALIAPVEAVLEALPRRLRMLMAGQAVVSNIAGVVLIGTK